VKILVSACLLGINCRYDGRSSLCELPDMPEGSCIIPACPEQLGGLPTPRSASMIKDGSGFDVLDGNAEVISSANQNVTEHFLRGAFETLKIARKLRVDICYLKDKSPSCGLSLLDEETGKTVGPGVTAALLIRENFKVVEIEARAVP